MRGSAAQKWATGPTESGRRRGSARGPLPSRPPSRPPEERPRAMRALAPSTHPKRLALARELGEELDWGTGRGRLGRFGFEGDRAEARGHLLGRVAERRGHW